MTNAEKILTFARKHLGKPYKLGARGPDLWDCSGLTKMAVKEIGYNFYHGASTQYRRGHETGDPAQYGYWSGHGTIDTLPMDRMALLFNRDKTEPNKIVMAHTGIYDGRGNVVQAGGYYRDGAKGVWEGTIDKRRWSHWATLKGADGIMAGIGFGAQGTDVKEMQKKLMDLGYSLEPYKDDGKFGAVTRAALEAFQADNGLHVTGIWSDVDNAKADFLLNEVQDFPPVIEPIDSRALLLEMKAAAERNIQIIGALLEGLV